MSISMVGLFLTGFLATKILPPKPQKYHWAKYLIMFFQWLIFPITMIIFGSLPATDAQTRMMLGGRFKLGFWVTEKKD